MNRPQRRRVTEHLARVRPLRVDWVLESSEFSARRGSDRVPSGWFLRNTGGTTAVDVALRVTSSSQAVAARGKDEQILKAEGPIPPGRAVRLHGTEKRYLPGQWFRRGEGADTHLWHHVEVDRDSSPTESEAFRAEEQFATVEWTDEKRKRRRKCIPIY